MDHQSIVDATRRWIASMVIGLNLCPFAQRVFDAGTIRYVVTDAANPNALLNDLARELAAFVAAPIATVETTLLIHPRLLSDFLEYNAFLGDAEQLLVDLDLQGIVQLASFHPRYQFAGTAADAVENYTNRSPFPMLHLLREASVSAVAANPRELLDIPRRNIATLRKLGRDEILERLKAIGERP